jgi:hypothetical protein
MYFITDLLLSLEWPFTETICTDLEIQSEAHRTSDAHLVCLPESVCVKFHCLSALVADHLRDTGSPLIITIYLSLMGSYFRCGNQVNMSLCYIIK